MIRAEHPRRCHKVIHGSQCSEEAVENSNYCKEHGGGLHEKTKVKGYLLGKYMARVSDFTNHKDIKSLSAEVGIMRMLIEEKLNSCNDKLTLTVQAPAISEMLMKLQKLVAQCHRLDLSLGKTLDEAQLIRICDAIAEVISRHVEDANILDKISEEISSEIARIALND